MHVPSAPGKYIRTPAKRSRNAYTPKSVPRLKHGCQIASSGRLVGQRGSRVDIGNVIVVANDADDIASRLDDIPVALLRCGKAAPALRSAQHNRRLSLRPLRDDRQRLAENALQKEIQFIRREPRRIRRVRRHDNLGTAIYDYITSHVSYDNEGLAAIYGSSQSGKDYLIFTAYGAEVNGRAVCQGYAAAVYRLMLMAGIDCRVIVGAVDGTGHAWNIVKLDGKYYYMDSTFDAGKDKYIHFMKDQGDFSDHIAEPIYREEAFTDAYPIADASLPTDVEPYLMEKDGFRFRPSLDHLVIRSYTGNDTDVIVPASIDGIPVKGIGQYTFSRNGTIESVTFSEGIETINTFLPFRVGN